MEPKTESTMPASSSTGESAAYLHIVEPTSHHTHSIMLLHGLGDNGPKFGAELLQTGFTSTGHTLPQLLPGARFIFPSAKRRRSSAINRALLRQWFDIARLPDPEYRRETQLQGLAESAAQLEPLVRAEVDEVGAGNVILGGISNGSAMSMALLMALGLPLGGYIGLCSYMPWQRDLLEAVSDTSNEGGLDDEDNPFANDDDATAEEKTPAVRMIEFERDLLGMDPGPELSDDKMLVKTPVFLGHGELDEKKPPAIGKAAAETLRACGYDVTWRLYPELGHWYQVPDEIDDIVDFIEGKVGWELSRTQAGVYDHYTTNTIAGAGAGS
ncbi:Alpha/Beta hydrolase protein [Microdochium bolleyi]|uniref:Alpha/Beta hydrolase protein n=1 Tax=Microdochium bolleyi TaxID=196109 RepID=A0A136IQX8_9PEZI|nr:Alpha/Beta hydrolase protein [Microdochium bolleyi]